MKAIGIKIVEFQPMRASMALQTGYKIELNQFVNTWNPYVEPKEVNDEVGKEVHA